MRVSNVNILLVLGLLTRLTILVNAATLSSSFTYQGQILYKGQPAQGYYDFEFRLFDSLQGGEQLGETFLIKEQEVIDGVLVVNLNFGDVFTGRALWLNIGLRPTSEVANPFTFLVPRQELTPVPFAQFALRSESSGGITGSGSVGRVPKFTDGTALGNSAIYESNGRVGINLIQPAEALSVAGNALLTGDLIAAGTVMAQTLIGAVDVSQITGLLGQGFTVQFPDVMDNSALMEMDGIPTTGPVVILAGPAYEIERILGFTPQGQPDDQPGFAMEAPFVFEADGAHAANLKGYFDDYLANPQGTQPRNMSIIILALDRSEVFRWNLWGFVPDTYGPGVDGRTRFRMVQLNLPDLILGYRMDPDAFGSSSSCNPATDKLVEIDGILGICPEVQVDETERLLTFTYDFAEGNGIFGWVSQLVEGNLDYRNLSVIERGPDGSEIGRRNYHKCFPVSYEQFTGYGLAPKIKARVVLSFDSAVDP